MEPIKDNPVFENYVSPNLCRDLKDAGLSGDVNYKWIIQNSTTELRTCYFDTDDYYKVTCDLLISAAGTVVLPAYSIKDIEKCLPFWLMTKGENGYEISLDKYFAIKSKQSFRLPDAMAALLLEAIQKSVVDLERVNYIISNKDDHGFAKLNK